MKARKILLFLLIAVFIVCLLPARPSNAMQIFVRVEIGGSLRTLTIEVEPGDYVGNVKEKIADKEGIPPERQRLYYNDALLDDARTLADYNVQKETYLYLMILPVTAAAQADLNGDGIVSIADVTYLLDYLAGETS